MPFRTLTIIICAGTILAVALGFRQTLGIFLPQISTSLGIGRESFALGLGLMNLFWGLGAPFTGAIADRYGPTRILVISGAAYSAGLAIMTLSNLGGEPLLGEQLITGGMLIGFGLSGAGFSVILGAVGRSVPEEKRSMALGLASMGGSLGQFLALPYAHVLIENYGWSHTLLILAVCSLIIVPLSYGLSGTGSNSLSNEKPDQSIKEAFFEASASPSFWLLTSGFFVCGVHVAFVAVHLPAYLKDSGFENWVGVAALTLIGFGNIIGTFIFGLLGDLYSRKKLLSGLYFSRSILITIFLLTPISETSVMVFSLGIGLLWLGTVPLTGGLVAKIFGPTYMSMLFGIIFLSHQVGAFLGSWLAGLFYDNLGNYDIMWWISIALGFMAAIIHWPISERPVQRLAKA